MPTFVYEVHTVCKATLHETWRVRSQRPLTHDELADVMLNGTEEGVTPERGGLCEMECIHEKGDDEEDREIVSVEAVDAAG
jgi:hypothetical protein